MELLDDIKNLIHQNRGKAHGWLIQHQKSGVAHHGPGHGQHLLLTAGKGTCNLLAALLQPGELLKNFFNCAGILFRRAGIAAHFQVLTNRHLLENPSSLRAQSHTKRHDPVGIHVGNHFSFKGDRTGAGLQNARNCIQGCGFTCTVCTDQGDNLPLIDIKGDILNGVDRTVINVDAVYMQHTVLLFHITVPPPSACPGMPR